MTYLVDTDVVIGFLKGKTPEVSLLKTLSPQGISISLITFGEIYEGIFYGRNPEQNEQVFRQFLQDVDVLPLTRLVMRRFAKIRGHLRKSGAILADMDLLIGATALQYKLTLITYNKKHFQRIPGLIIY
jgi:tRNA(fMet)-specific endonuclease VapC